MLSWFAALQGGTLQPIDFSRGLFSLSIRNFYMLVKLVLISDTNCILMICYTPIATFQKAGTCLDAQQSMAKQPIKGCVSNQNCTCGKSVSEKSE